MGKPARAVYRQVRFFSESVLDILIPKSRCRDGGARRSVRVKALYNVELQYLKINKPTPPEESETSTLLVARQRESFGFPVRN
jgi:hypothetical protein